MPIRRATVAVKRVYDAPAPQDGARILVDRLWPRGLTKAAAALDDWPKVLAPSDALRKWAHARPDDFDAFRARYRAELAQPPAREALAALREKAEQGKVTLLFAARRLDRNNATVLAEFLRE